MGSRLRACEKIEPATVATHTAVIPAKAGIHLSIWNKLLDGSPVRGAKVRAGIRQPPANARVSCPRRRASMAAKNASPSWGWHGFPPSRERRRGQDFERFGQFGDFLTRSKAGMRLRKGSTLTQQRRTVSLQNRARMLHAELCIPHKVSAMYSPCRRSRRWTARLFQEPLAESSIPADKFALSPATALSAI